MDCREYKRRLADGEGAVDAGLAEHLESCSACREIAAGEGRLASALGSLEESAQPDESSQLPDFDELEEAIEREQGGFARLREASRTTRTAVLLVVSLAVCAAIFNSMLRPDFGVYPSLRFWSISGGFLSMSTMLFVRGLRPLHKPPATLVSTLASAGITLGFVGIVHALPPAHTAMSLSLGGLGADLLPTAFGCFVAGAVFASPVLLATFLTARNRQPSWLTGFFLAAAAGLVGNLGLHLHCPIVHPEHLLLGHATVPIAYASVAAAILYFVGRPSGR